LPVLIINSAAPGEPAFIRPILETIASQVPVRREMDLSTEVCHWTELKDTREIGNYSAVIISASPMGDNANFGERVQCFQWLRTAQMPVLGICAGHQFIGHTFGSRLIKDAEAEEGMHPVRIQSWDPLFTGFGEELNVMQQHRDAVSLPDNFILLARSGRCRVQAMKHQQLPIYGVQWHAEISTPRLILNLLEMCS
jgi:GMP synthase (glutamine-hydrolysing)